MTRLFCKFLLLALVSVHLVSAVGQHPAGEDSHQCSVSGNVSCIGVDVAFEAANTDDLDFCESEGDDHLYFQLTSEQSKSIRAHELPYSDHGEQLPSLYQSRRLLRPPQA